MTSSTEPLVVVGQNGLTALSPGDGAPLWSVSFDTLGLEMVGFNRLGRLGSHVVVANGTEVLFVEIGSGEVVARHTVTFRVEQLVVNAPWVAVSGILGLAFFKGVRLAWRVAPVQHKAEGLFGGTSTRWAQYDGAGRLVRELDFWPNTGSVSDLGLLFGTALAQTDRNT